jgi:flagellar basal body P-ring formation protein FlgA
VKVLILAIFTLIIAVSGLPHCHAVNAETLRIPVPVRTITAGEQINSVEFQEKLFEVSPIAKKNYVVQQAQLSNMEAFRTLRAGKPIPLAFLRKRVDVWKGKTTVARFDSFGVQIVGQLVPLRDGYEGEIIPCKNLASGLSINATVMVDGTLSVGVP